MRKHQVKGYSSKCNYILQKTPSSFHLLIPSVSKEKSEKLFYISGSHRDIITEDD